MTKHRLGVDEYVAGVRAGDRAVLGRAITLIESRRADDQVLAQAVVAALLPWTGGAHRIGITGVPGVGKSSLIEALGGHLTGLGHRVAVLAVDPSSLRSGGSILGDKTRMQSLARDPRAFVRPTPTLGELGGVARHTRETLLLCEAANYDVVLVETVGVGQSEVMVAQLVDCFVVLMLAGAGDELQGIKRGILELVDVLAITKADGEGVKAARWAQAEYRAALHLMRPRYPAWTPTVLTCSAQTQDGVAALWQAIREHRAALATAGVFSENRARQQVYWMERAIEAGLLERFHADPAVAGEQAAVAAEVRDGRMSPDHAAGRLLALFMRSMGR
ncbi:MAG: methylmalonyl Co-A mutase-associated GTPase MeaB [Nannocystis sp.]|nr:methylmalonyl Co-A mutase-associated GTPase MeaB [Nannocystis sp.]MBA3547199.1 methylmalonyl Co-A mutase-associated GTPase MeaB [Nannocystis sp.]